MPQEKQSPAESLRTSVAALQTHLTFAAHHQAAAFDGALGVHESNAAASLVAALAELVTLLDLAADLELRARVGS